MLRFCLGFILLLSLVASCFCTTKSINVSIPTGCQNLSEVGNLTFTKNRFTAGVKPVLQLTCNTTKQFCAESVVCVNQNYLSAKAPKWQCQASGLQLGYTVVSSPVTCEPCLQDKKFTLEHSCSVKLLVRPVSTACEDLFKRTAMTFTAGKRAEGSENIEEILCNSPKHPCASSVVCSRSNGSTSSKEWKCRVKNIAPGLRLLATKINCEACPLHPGNRSVILRHSCSIMLSMGASTKRAALPPIKDSCQHVSKLKSITVSDTSSQQQRIKCNSTKVACPRQVNCTKLRSLPATLWDCRGATAKRQKIAWADVDCALCEASSFLGHMLDVKNCTVKLNITLLKTRKAETPSKKPHKKKSMTTLIAAIVCLGALFGVIIASVGFVGRCRKTD